MKILKLTLISALAITTSAFAVKPSEKIKELGLILTPPSTSSVGSFVPVRCAGNMIYISGHISRKDGKPWEGKLGKDIKTEEGKVIARAIAVDLINTINNFVKNIDDIRFVKVTSFVNSTPDFTEQHLVTNGASDLILEVFGESGKHARSAIGVPTLPLNAAVEIELILENTKGGNACK